MNIRRTARVLSVVAAFAGSSCGRNHTNEIAADALVGTYRLVSLEEGNPGGTVHRADAAGSLVLTKEGRMAVQVMYRGAQSPMAAAPVQYARGGYEASFGSFHVDVPAAIVTHPNISASSTVETNLANHHRPGIVVGLLGQHPRRRTQGVVATRPSGMASRRTGGIQEQDLLDEWTGRDHLHRTEASDRDGFQFKEARVVRHDVVGSSFERGRDDRNVLGGNGRIPGIPLVLFGVASLASLASPAMSF